MPAGRRGIVLPAVLAAIIALGMLSSLALFDAVQEWRVANLAGDRVVARTALLEGVDAASSPPGLAALCLRAPLDPILSEGVAVGGGRWSVIWSHLGEGTVRAEIAGSGRFGARTRAIALLRPDSTERTAGLLRCPTATRLVPAGPGWLTGHPAG